MEIGRKQSTKEQSVFLSGNRNSTVKFKMNAGYRGCFRIFLMQHALLLLVSGYVSFQPPCHNNKRNFCLPLQLQMSHDKETTLEASRRSLIQAVTSITFAFLTSITAVSAGASMLDEYYYGDKDAAAKGGSPTEVPLKKGDDGIDPTLRASYYYPTAKKRYLPRIQMVSNQIASITESLLQEDGIIDWDTASTFAETTAENAILPLKLYESSLRGQGLSMANSYAKAMKNDAAVFEKKTKELQQAIKKRNSDLALSALTDMSFALTDYRKAGRLTEDIEEIPSVDDIRRMTMRKPTVKVPTR